MDAISLVRYRHARLSKVEPLSKKIREGEAAGCPEGSAVGHRRARAA
jgi:hypothetical protein